MKQDPFRNPSPRSVRLRPTCFIHSPSGLGEIPTIRSRRRDRRGPSSPVASRIRRLLQKEPCPHSNLRFTAWPIYRPPAVTGSPGSRIAPPRWPSSSLRMGASRVIGRDFSSWVLEKSHRTSVANRQAILDPIPRIARRPLHSRSGRDPVDRTWWATR